MHCLPPAFFHLAEGAVATLTAEGCFQGMALGHRWITFLAVAGILFCRELSSFSPRLAEFISSWRPIIIVSGGGTRDAVDDPVLQDTVRKVIVLYLVFLAFLKDQWDVWGLQSKVKEIKGSWEDEVQRRKYAKEHESNSKVEEKRQKLFAQFGIDEDSLLETSSEYLNYTSEQRYKLSAIKQRWEELKSDPPHKGTFDLTEEDNVADDFTFYKFLKARKWDVDKAFTMYKNYRLFRLKEGVSRYTKDAPGPFGAEALLQASEKSFEASDGLETNPALRLVAKDPCEKYFRAFCSAVNSGYSKSGSPIYLERTGEISPIYSTMMKHIDSDEVVKRHIRQQEMANERCKEISEILGVPVGKQTLIFDLKGMSFYPNTAAMNVFKRVLNIDANFYPETLHAHFLINAPAVFTAVWRLVGSWLDPVTKKKFHVLGTNYKETLLKHIDKSQLPIEYGGTNSFQLPHVTMSMDVGEAHAKRLHQQLEKRNEIYSGVQASQRGIERVVEQ